MGHLRVGGCQHRQQAALPSPAPRQASVRPRWVTTSSSACTPEKGSVHARSELPPRAGWGGGRDGMRTLEIQRGGRDWGTHGRCLPPPRAVLAGKEGWVGWWVGDGSPHSFDQQVSPGCAAVSCSVCSLPHSCLVPVLHPSHPPTTPALSPPSFLNQPHPTGG